MIPAHKLANVLSYRGVPAMFVDGSGRKVWSTGLRRGYTLVYQHANGVRIVSRTPAEIEALRFAAQKLGYFSIPIGKHCLELRSR